MIAVRVGDVGEAVGRVISVGSGLAGRELHLEQVAGKVIAVGRGLGAAGAGLEPATGGVSQRRHQPVGVGGLQHMAIAIVAIEAGELAQGVGDTHQVAGMMVGGGVTPPCFWMKASVRMSVAIPLTDVLQADSRH